MGQREVERDEGWWPIKASLEVGQRALPDSTGGILIVATRAAAAPGPELNVNGLIKHGLHRIRQGVADDTGTFSNGAGSDFTSEFTAEINR